MSSYEDRDDRVGNVGIFKKKTLNPITSYDRSESPSGPCGMHEILNCAFYGVISGHFQFARLVFTTPARPPAFGTPVGAYETHKCCRVLYLFDGFLRGEITLATCGRSFGSVAFSTKTRRKTRLEFRVDSGIVFFFNVPFVVCFSVFLFFFSLFFS